MSDQSYTTAFTVEQSPSEVYDAVINVRGWWSEEIEGGTQKPGDEFSYHFQDMHRCRIRVTEVVAGERVSWLVLENYFSFTRDETEWTGTTMQFDISEKDGRTELRFTHEGLVPAYECWDACSAGWSNYVDRSLRSLITTGEGQPITAGLPRTAAEQELAGR